MIRLTDEEMAGIISRCEGTVKEARHEVNKAQLKKAMEWGDGICEEHKHFCERWHCPECRQALLDEVK